MRDIYYTRRRYFVPFGAAAVSETTISDALEPDSRDRVKVTFTRLRVSPRTRARRTDWRDGGSVATGQRSCQQAASRHAVFEPIDFAGARVGSVGRLSGRRDIDAQSSKLSILRKT